MKEYKPKAIRTLRKMVFDIKEHCCNVSKSKFFGCHTCPYHVIYPDDTIECYFVYEGNKRPSEWNINEMGTYVPAKEKK